TLNVGSQFVQSAGSAILDGGSLAGQMNIQGGVLKGTGTITGTVVNGGQVSPGFSPGLITVQGDSTQTPPANFVAEIGGYTAGTQYDQLDVTGNVSLAGTLHVALINGNGFTPKVVDRFTILDDTGSALIRGAFDARAEGAYVSAGAGVFQTSY